MTFYFYNTKLGDLYRVRAANRSRAIRKLVDHRNELLGPGSLTFAMVADSFDSFSPDQVTEL